MATRSPDPAVPYRPMRARRVLILHLAPGLATFLAALALAPLAVRLGLPASFSLTLAFGLVLTPIELALLLHAGHRATGRWSPRALPSVLAYRRPLGRWWWLVPPLPGCRSAAGARPRDKEEAQT